MNFYLAQTVLNSIWTPAHNYLLRVSKVTALSLISMHYQLTNLIAGRLIGSSVGGGQSWGETQNEKSSPAAPPISHAYRLSEGRVGRWEDATEHAYVWLPVSCGIYTDSEFYWDCSYIISWMHCLHFCLYQGDHVILMTFSGMFQEFQDARRTLTVDPPKIKDMGL